MKTINRLFAAALVLFVAAACYNKEIESPDNRQDPETQDISEQTGLKITASIIQTRVTYTDGTTTLNQQWEKGENGDIVFGFIDDANHTPVVLKVYDINNGVATLVPTTGGDALSAMEENTYVNLIYTGGSPQSLVASDETYSYSIDMTDQDGKIPACMHARARKEGNAIEFDFVNDCAIFEIVSLTGVAEDHSSDSQDLESITVSNVFTSGKYTFGGNGSVSFDGVSGQTVNVTITLGDGWTVDDSGIINFNGEPKPVLIAVAPKTADKNASITITAEADNNIHYGYDFGSKSIEPKKCYVVSAKPIVAKTEDGQYFTTVTGAFAHAADLFKLPDFNTAETNKVTLVRDCGLAGVTKQQDGTYTSNVGGSNPLLINGYDVTLDLNGHVLSLAGNNEFFGVNRKTTDDTKDSDILNKFIITDSKGGKITSYNDDDENGNYIVRNLGKLQIDGGTFQHEGDWSVVKNFGSGQLTIKEGEYRSNGYYTIINEGEATILNGTFSAGHFDDESDEAVIFNTGSLTVEGGTLTSKDVTLTSEDVTVINNYGSLIVKGGTLTSTFSTAISNSGTLSISENSGKTTKVTANNGIAITNYSKLEISGGTVSSPGHVAIDSAYGELVNITGGTIESSSSDKAAITGSSGTTINISGGTVDYKGGKYAIGMLSGDTGVGYLNISGSARITSSSCTTIHLSKTVECTISGGIVETDSETSYALEVDIQKPSEPIKCTITGGIIKSAGPTALAFSQKSDLSISWTDSSTGSGPFIYSKADNSDPIIKVDNIQCSIEISGGYLYADNDSANDRCFIHYSSLSTLTISNFFYSNILNYKNGAPNVVQAQYTSLGEAMTPTFDETSYSFGYKITGLSM